jgi:hypothetical protein
MRSSPGSARRIPLERAISEGNGPLSRVYKASRSTDAPVEHTPRMHSKKSQCLDNVFAISCDAHLMVDWRGAEAQFYGGEAFEHQHRPATLRTLP